MTFFGIICQFPWSQKRERRHRNNGDKTCKLNVKTGYVLGCVSPSLWVWWQELLGLVFSFDTKPLRMFQSSLGGNFHWWSRSNLCLCPNEGQEYLQSYLHPSSGWLQSLCWRIHQEKCPLSHLKWKRWCIGAQSFPVENQLSSKTKTKTRTQQQQGRDGMQRGTTNIKTVK